MVRFVSILAVAWIVVLPGAAWGESQTPYDKIRAGIRRVIAENPASAQGFTLGESDSGLPIEGLAIGNGPLKELVVATHHGNEYGSTYVAAAFAQTLAKNPIPGRTVYVIPVLNIAGYNAGRREEPVRSGQADGRYIGSQDPNRDYAGPCGSENGGPYRLKSTKALVDFVDKQGIVTSLTLHTFKPAVVWPWGVGRQAPDPYPEIFVQLTKWLVELSHYRIGNNTEVLYPANGTFEDYAFWKHGIWSVLMELGRSHSPSQSDIAEMIRVNVPAMAKTLALAPQQRATKHDFDGVCFRGLRRPHLE